MSTFEKYRVQSYEHQFVGQLRVGAIAGGIPTDPRVAEGWLRTKLADTDDIIRDQVAQTMIDMGVDAEEAAAQVDQKRHLNGFKRDALGLYIEGRQLKAALKEAGSIAVAAGKLQKRGWGLTNKGVQSFIAEHVFVLNEKLYLRTGDPLEHVQEPSGVTQRFVHTHRGAGIQYEEFVENAVIDFVVVTDQNIAEKDWANIWLTGERQGLGATRSQGYGVYEMLLWERRDNLPV